MNIALNIYETIYSVPVSFECNHAYTEQDTQDLTLEYQPDITVNTLIETCLQCHKWREIESIPEGVLYLETGGWRE